MATVQAFLVFAARFLLLVLLQSAATFAVVEAGHEEFRQDSSAPSIPAADQERSLSVNPTVNNASVNLVVRNMARGSVTFQLEKQLGPSDNCMIQAAERVVETGQRAVMEGIAVSAEYPVVQVGVTVKTSTMHGPVKKVLQINLARYFDGEEADPQKLSRRALVLTAVESWKLKSGRYLVIHLGHRKVALSFKL